MSQIPTQKDDNRSGTASDFVQVDQPDEVPGQQETQQQQSDLTGSTRDFVQALKAELMDELKDEFGKMLSTKSEQHRKEMAQLKDGFAKEMAQLESKNRKLEEEVMSMVEVKNELEEIIQQKMENFGEEMDKNGQQAIGSNLNKLDYMWSQLVIKSKILANPKGIVWNRSYSYTYTEANIISECGLKTICTDIGGLFAIATEGFAISGEHCRKENFQFPGTILYYYEVTILNLENTYLIGFTDGSVPSASSYLGDFPNSYGIVADYYKNYGCLLWGEEHEHELDHPIGSISAGDVFGSGLMLNSKNELAIFFTLNGILLVKQTQINPTVDRLYPTVSAFGSSSLEANFGDNLVAPNHSNLTRTNARDWSLSRSEKRHSCAYGRNNIFTFHFNFSLDIHKLKKGFYILCPLF